ncbi:MAG: DUF115 domain-containing protein [Euryarchaeota archaeon]|nr:DUF115 domain-containing protein [Euryarchaeota archaeon]
MSYIKKSWEKNKIEEKIPANIWDGIAARGSFVVIKTDQLFKDPDQKTQEIIDENLSIPEQMNRRILSANLKLWMENLLENIPKIKKSKNISKIPKVNSKTAIVVGAGPSFKEKNHIEILKTIKKQTIISTDRMLIPLLKAGIEPSYVISVDGHRKFILPYFDDDVVNKNISTVGIMAVTVASNVVNRFPNDIHFFTPIMDNPKIIASITNAVSYMTNTSILSSGGNVGVTCLNFAYYLGFKNIILTGLDMGYTKDTPIEKSAYYPVVKEIDSTMTPEKYKKLFIVEGFNPDFNVEYYTDLTWKSHINNLIEQSESMLKEGIRIINATEGGSLHGGAIIGCRLEEAIKKYG